MPRVAAAVALLAAGCVYDYSGLGGRPGDAGANQPRPGSSSGGILGSGSVPAFASTGGSGGGPVFASTGGSGGGLVTTMIVSSTGGQPPDSSGGAGPTGGAGQPGAGGDGTAATGGVGAGGAAVGAGGGSGSGGGNGNGSGGGGSLGTGGAPVRGIISIDFIGGYTPGTANLSSNAATAAWVSLPAMAATELAGVKRAAYWNPARGPSGSRTGLVLSDGKASAANLTWDAPPWMSSPGVWWNSYANTAGDAHMMNGYLDPGAPAMPATVAVDNLPAAVAVEGYDVYVYVSGALSSGARGYRYSIGDAAIEVIQTGPSPATFTGYVLAPPGGSGNYIVFRNVTGPLFTLVATPGTGASLRAPVNGMQIVFPTGS